MINMKVKFHPVGQGLFTTGEINYGGNKLFNFVYDCGTLSSRSLIKTAINSCKDLKNIHMGIISHFDNDHINGFEDLLKTSSINNLILPYMNLEERLYLAFSSGNTANSRIIKFYIDPIEYITTKYPGKINNIILVPSSFNSQSANEQYEHIEQESQITFTSNQRYNKNGVNIYKLVNRGRISLNKIVEFIPYNDGSLSYKSDSSFRHLIKSESHKITYKQTTSTKLVLNNIKNLYDSKFGKSPKQKNIISLFMYIGPINDNEKCLLDNTKTLKCIRVRHLMNHYCSNGLSKYFFHKNLIGKNSILFTGDGDLSSLNKYKSLELYLGKKRLHNLWCLQVMHHGAKSSWFNGLASKIDPIISIFSSDPSRRNTKHPDSEVVKDFLKFNPFQVDKQNYLECHSTLCIGCNK